jgi:Spy/CpxP family protein refolding chaperone
MMNRTRLLAVATVMMFALAGMAQQSATGSAGGEKQNQSSAQNRTEAVEHHLKVLSEKLNLTPDQEDRVRPILYEMHDAMGKAEQNQSLSDDERNAQKHSAFMKADGQIREVLTDDQKKTLDQMEQEMHPGMHGDQSGPGTAQK